MNAHHLRPWRFLAVLLPATALATAAWLLWTELPPDPATPAVAGSLDWDGRTRHWQLVHPPVPAANPPVVLALHPSRSSGARLRRYLGPVLEPLAARAGAIVVYPDGFEGHFNDCRRAASYSARQLGIDDVGFIEAMLSRLAADHGIQPEPAHAIGYSNGAHFGLRLAMERPGLLDGLVMIAANVPTPDNLACETPGLALRRVVLIQGTADPINPHAGGPVTLFGLGNRGTVRSALDSARWFAAALGAEPAGERERVDPNGLRATMTDWRGQGITPGTAPFTAVRLVSIHGGGHTVPQTGFRFPRLLGPTWRDDSILGEAWALLSGPAAD